MKKPTKEELRELLTRSEKEVARLHKENFSLMLRLSLRELDLESDTALRERMSDILRRTADALHGAPLPDGYWSWHDLPELAQQLYTAAYSHTTTVTFTDRIPYAAGWWWRVPYGWLLRAGRFLKTGD